MKTGSPEWHTRVEQLLAEEASEIEQWWYLSFATDDQFLGAAIVRGRGVTSALREAHRLGINPGGQVMGVQVGNETPGHPVNRLLSRADLGPGAKSVRQARQARQKE